MKTELCGALEKLTKLGTSVDAAIEANEELIDVLWKTIIKAIQEPRFLTETEIKQLLNLDRIMKWEFLGYEKSVFDWSAVSWPEIGEEAKKCASSICIGKFT